MKSSCIVNTIVGILQVFIIVQNKTLAYRIISPTIFRSVSQCMSRTKAQKRSVAQLFHSQVMNIHNVSHLLSFRVSRQQTGPLCRPQTGLRKAVSTNKGRLHSCRLRRHVHHGDQTGVLTSPSLLSLKHLARLPSLIVTVFCRLSVTWPLTSKNKIIIMMMRGKASRRPPGLCCCCSPGRLKCVCSY